jgi:hypothetical protein
LKWIPLLLTSVVQFSYALDVDINRACDELDEQKETLVSSLSTSLEEANLAGQCIGWSKINKGRRLKVFKPCSEFLEQKNNILGDLSTSFIEANKAGVCLGAIFASCSGISYVSVATHLVDYGDYFVDQDDILRVGCNG